ncbi:hypothetical protein BACCAC_03810 [Bacteroides caccae ATCC 43185]|nr:hypothetical protein BACCAC_03810 [Bacteroides caccae ATCC 43185]
MNKDSFTCWTYAEEKIDISFSSAFFLSQCSGHTFTPVGNLTCFWFMCTIK